MPLKPRAPVFFAIALFAINLSALSVKCNLTCNVGQKQLATKQPSKSTVRKGIPEGNH